MKKTALVIMAAGIGSRFGKGVKQLTPVDAQNHVIMDYSIHDAIQAGFNKVIFILRREIFPLFQEIIGARIEKICENAGVECCYAFQELKKVPSGFTVPEGREKPWGTGQAVLAAKEWLSEPFLVINADDYYGKSVYTLMHDWLCGNRPENEYALAGYVLKNTLPENGAVTRGVCAMNAEGFLTDIQETAEIEKNHEKDVIEAGGVRMDPNACVSMNMWGLTPAFVQSLEDGFCRFLTETVPQNPLKAEFLLPTFIGELLHENRASVKVLSTKETWFGMTYGADRQTVMDSFSNLLSQNTYKKDLFSDL